MNLANGGFHRTLFLLKGLPEGGEVTGLQELEVRPRKALHQQVRKFLQ